MSTKLKQGFFCFLTIKNSSKTIRLSHSSYWKLKGSLSAKMINTCNTVNEILPVDGARKSDVTMFRDPLNVGRGRKCGGCFAEVLI